MIDREPRATCSGAGGRTRTCSWSGRAGAEGGLGTSKSGLGTQVSSTPGMNCPWVVAGTLWSPFFHHGVTSNSLAASLFNILRWVDLEEM
jgi:hypothetical protein